MSLLLCYHLGYFLVSLLHLFCTNKAPTRVYLILHRSRLSFQLRKDYSLLKSWQLVSLFIRLQEQAAMLASLTAFIVAQCYKSALNIVSRLTLSYLRQNNALYHMCGYERSHFCL